MALEKSERELVRSLLVDYDKRVRPVKSGDQVIHVTIQPQIYSLVDVVSSLIERVQDELHEQIRLLLWIPQASNCRIVIAELDRRLLGMGSH